RATSGAARPAYRSRGRARVSAAAALDDLRAACKADNALAAHAALIAWTRAEGSPAPVATGQVHRDAFDAQTLDAQAFDANTFRTPAMAKAAEDLRQHLYGAGSSSAGSSGAGSTRWRGAACLSAVRGECAARARSAPKRRGARLAPLYP
ncbi:MAG: hypothetical protein ABII76_13310, partial [Pseudomonadota bacterium]